MSEEKKDEGSQAIVQWDPGTASEAWTLAKYYGASKLIPRALNGTADVFLVIAAGRDFGWSPMQSMRGLYVVEGKPALSADAMVGIAKSKGLCKWFRLVESTPEIATYETLREGDPAPVRMSFTMAQAERAGLKGKSGPWKTYPDRMLRNRCKSALAKEVYEELFFGAYEESEAEEIPRRVERAPAASTKSAPAATVPAGSQTVDVVPVPVPAKAPEQTETPPAAAPASVVPPHDAVTGEVEDPLFAAEPQESLVDKFVLRFQKATSIVPGLSEIAGDIREANGRGLITDAERTFLASQYKEHQARLIAAVGRAA